MMLHNDSLTVLHGNNASLQHCWRPSCKASLVLLVPTQLAQMATAAHLVWQDTKVFWMKIRACRDGTLKNNQTRWEMTQHFDTIPTSCAILPLLTQIHVRFVCLLVACRGLWKTVWWVHVDVHGEWVMLWVAAMYNVLAILSMTGIVCLACMQKLWNPWAVLGLVWCVWYMYVGV